jgi:hypothetical protein
MTKEEAKRIVCASFAVHMDNGSSNEFLFYDEDHNEYSDEDHKRMKEAFNDLVAELWRRGGNKNPRIRMT